MVKSDSKKELYYNEIRNKYGEKLFISRRYTNLLPNYFLIRHVVFVLIVKIVIKNEKFFFTSNLCEIRRKCQKRKLFISKRSANYLLTTYSFIYQKRFKKFNFPVKIYEIQIKCWKTKLFILKGSTISVLSIFS